MSPTVLMNISDIPGTGLITEGSRVNYSMLIAGENNEVQTFSELMSVKVNDSARISNPSDSSERTNQTINRSKQFLSLTVIISVLLSGIAISMSARRFAKKNGHDRFNEKFWSQKTIHTANNYYSVDHDWIDRCDFGFDHGIYC